VNYYERIQRAVDYLEERMTETVDVEAVARESALSAASLYRLFFAMTGYTVMDYLRRRRISEASSELAARKDVPILGVALRYGFDSHEAFTRAFRKLAGMNPGAMRKAGLRYSFERMHIMDKYFDIQDPGLLEKYPDIRVLRELPPMRVVSLTGYGIEPEAAAWQSVSSWLGSLQPALSKTAGFIPRYFGFNNPSPVPGRAEYGYEVWVTVGDDFDPADVPSTARLKTVPGGLYAVTGVKGSTGAIPAAWRRFSAWLKDSKYMYGEHQWLEEHLSLDEGYNPCGGFDLYMPIRPVMPGAAVRGPA